MTFIPARRLLALLSLAVAGAGASASDLPPADAKPLSQILEAVEAAHPGVILSAEFDDRRWEVISCQPGSAMTCRELQIHPRSAKTLRSSRDTSFDKRPPEGSKTAAQIARAVEDRKLGTITEIEFDDPAWEVSLRGHGVRAKLYIDAASGEIQRCRGQGCPAR